MALVIDIADAVTAELNAAEAGTFSQDITAERRVLPTCELSELTQLKVTIVPKAVEIAGASRAMSRHDVQVDIGIQKKLGRDLDTEVAELCGLVDEIAEYLKRRPLAAKPEAAWTHTANEPVHAPEHLSEQRLFTSVLTITYRVLQ